MTSNVYFLIFMLWSWLFRPHERSQEKTEISYVVQLHINGEFTKATAEELQIVQAKYWYTRISIIMKGILSANDFYEFIFRFEWFIKFLMFCLVLMNKCFESSFPRRMSMMGSTSTWNPRLVETLFAYNILKVDVELFHQFWII